MNNATLARSGQSPSGPGAPRRGRIPETSHDRILHRAIDSIRPSPENQKLYRPIDPGNPDRELKELARDIRRQGILEPLVISLDNWVLSGHRRLAGAKMAGLKQVPVRVHPVSRQSQPDEFIRLLREFNRQRTKTRGEKLREEVLEIDPHQAYQSMIAHRESQADVDVQEIEIRGVKRRSKISEAKAPMVQAVKKVLQARQDFWPLDVRQIHYALLNDPPLKHANKPKSQYANTPRDYKNLVDLLARARLEGLIPMRSIADSTRLVQPWNCPLDVRSFMQDEIGGFLKNYWRDLMQGQPNHIEIMAEKNTLGSTVLPVAMEFCIPYTLGRGFCSLPPRNAMARRFRKSGKEKLVLLTMSDFDPEGEEIAHSFARSMRDDFGIKNIVPVKVSLTAKQVVQFKLPPVMSAKKTSVNYDKFVDKHGTDVFELEALPPETLQQLLREAIDSVIDVDAFNAELESEKQDAVFLEAKRHLIHEALADVFAEDEAGD